MNQAKSKTRKSKKDHFHVDFKHSQIKDVRANSSELGWSGEYIAQVAKITNSFDSSAETSSL